MFGPSSFTVAGTPGAIYDNGTVSLTVGSVTETVPYSEAKNASSLALATALRNAIVGDSAAPVTVSQTGSMLTLTTKTQSSSSFGYSFVDSYDSVDFTSPSYTFSPGAGTLSGSSSGTTIPGTVYSYVFPSNTGYAANGNVLAYTDSVIGAWQYGYDGLNQLTSGQMTSAGPNTYAFGCWAYDSLEIVWRNPYRRRLSSPPRIPQNIASLLPELRST